MDKPRNVFMGSNRWREAPIAEVAQFSPQLALARALGVPLAPRILSIVQTFNDTTTVSGYLSWTVDGAPARLDQFGVVDRILYEIDQPSANSGQVLKPLTDFFFEYQSGITATMMVVGAPRYIPAADFTPLKLLLASAVEDWPMGWILNYTQAVQMQFTPSALLTPPTTVTVAFRLWQAVDASFIGMTDSVAFDRLQNEAGIDCSKIRNSTCRS